MLVPKFIISKELINNEISMLNDILSQQRQLKQTLVSFLEKISDGLYNAKDEQDSISLISCLKGIQKSFENIKSNIAELLALKSSLENLDINNVDNSFFDEYNDKYTKLFNKISEDNIFYYSFMESLLKYMKVYFPGQEETPVEISKATKKAEAQQEQKQKIVINKDTTPQNNMDNTISLSMNDFVDASTIDSLQVDNQHTLVLNTQEVKQMFETEPTDDSSIISLDFDKKLEKSDESKKKKIEEFKEEIQETSIITPKKEDPTITVQRNETPKDEKIVKNDTRKTSINTPKENCLIEKTLIVSEKKNNVILPYSTEDLEEYFSTNPEKYSSIQDIIDKEYTISLSRYKNQAFSRFKEAYNLAKHKSNLSVVQALAIANECFLNTNLDPTIITACKNIEELEIYLGCLEENKLEDFNCFKIVYDLI